MSASPVEIVRIYNLLGEGFVVELSEGNTHSLYDRRGLQHRILERKRAGLDTREEERALAQINSFGPYHELFEFAPDQPDRRSS